MRLPASVIRTGVPVCALALSFAAQLAFGGTPGERTAQPTVAQQAQLPGAIPAATAAETVTLPAGVRLLRDVAYGRDPQQRMDVYLPPQAKQAPVLLMVHGGAWRYGDKGARAVVENKLARWAPQGFILVSVNYRLWPRADPLQQAEDVAHALAAAQGKAQQWGGDPAGFILLGHSAGAHLVALLAAAPARALALGARPWLGAIVLDSAALDLVQLMQARHPRLYDRVFGSNPAYWQSVSPFDQLTSAALPMLVVCSTRRQADSCTPAHAFAAKVNLFGRPAGVLEQDLSHRQINQELGLPGTYTDTVEGFMATLDPAVRIVLASHGPDAR